MQTLLESRCPDCGSMEIAYDAVHELKYCNKCGVVLGEISFEFD